MKIVNEQAAKASEAPIQRLQDAGKGKVWLWDRQTGEPKAFYSVDATELLEKYSNRWSANVVTTHQASAEDVEIIEATPAKDVAEVIPELQPELESWPTKDDEPYRRSRNRKTKTASDD